MAAIVPPIVVTAANLAAADRSGIVEYRVRQTAEIDGGPIHERDDITIVVVADGGEVVKVRVLAFTADGKVQSDAARRKVETQVQADKSRFATPFDTRSLPDYSFAVDGSTIRFVSLKRDGEHGDGWFRVDADGHVVAMTYAPNVMPQYASSGSVTVDRAAVLPGFWATTTSVSTFAGHYLFIHGAATFTTRESGFRRFGDRAAALADLAALQE